MALRVFIDLRLLQNWIKVQFTSNRLWTADYDLANFSNSRLNFSASSTNSA